MVRTSFPPKPEGVRVLLLDVERALGRVVGRAGGDADDAVGLAALDDHGDLAALVDLEVRRRARVPRLDEPGPVDLAPAGGVEHVGAREPVGLLEGHDGVLDLRREARAQVGNAELQPHERREHALDVRARGAGGKRLGADGDLARDGPTVQACGGRQDHAEGEAVDAAERDVQGGLAVGGAGLVGAHDRAFVRDLDDHEAVVGGRRDLDDPTEERNGQGRRASRWPRLDQRAWARCHGVVAVSSRRRRRCGAA